MPDENEEIKKFRQLLDKLPYLSEAEKLLACSMHVIATDETKHKMLNFYLDQLQTYQNLTTQYNQKIQAAKEKFLQNIQAIKNDTFPKSA